jgi:hypothetical protein
VVQPRIEEIKIVPERVPFKSGVQFSINLRNALETTPIAANVGQQYDGLQRTRSRHPRVGVPVNTSVTDGRQARMDWGAKNTPVDIHHEPWASKELPEHLVEIRGLPDVPQRLGMVHRYNAVESPVRRHTMSRC